jgi:hypothetical protein
MQIDSALHEGKRRAVETLQIPELPVAFQMARRAYFNAVRDEVEDKHLEVLMGYIMEVQAKMDDVQKAQLAMAGQQEMAAQGMAPPAIQPATPVPQATHAGVAGVV